MNMPTCKDFGNAANLLAALTPNTVVRSLEGDTKPFGQHPFDHHLYSCFVVKDSDPPCDDIITEYLEPAIQELAKAIVDFPMIGVQSLPPSGMEGVILCYNFPGATLPLRFTLSYDAMNQGTMVVADLFFRPVGDYHRTIINGPLHLAEMPFVHDPPNGHKFDYKHLATPKSYWDSYGDSEGYAMGDMPDLEPNVSADSLHRYRVNGAYCYYRGETLLKEL